MEDIMNWELWNNISAIILIVSIVVAFIMYTRRIKWHWITSRNLFVFGVFCSAWILLYPTYRVVMPSVNALILSAQNSVRLFAFDDNIFDIIERVEEANVNGNCTALPGYYKIFLSLYHTLTPVLTITVILSFFRNIVSYVQYKLSFYKDAHIFSELNEKTLTLAKSIDKKENKKRGIKYKFIKSVVIVFADILDKNEEAHLDLIDEAEKMGAILFRKDIQTINFSRLSKKALNFYLISDDEQEKIRHANFIIKRYDISEKVELRLFSDDIRSELLFAAKNVKHMKAIRVNDIQSLIYHNLDVNGVRLFENSRSVTDTKNIISAVIVGLGKYGTEMMKALSWFCQLEGYKIKINAFDIDQQAKEHFTNMCPELMSDKFNKQDVPGEAQYEINIHGGVDVYSPDFYEALSQIKDATYIFVCLGSDKENLAISTKIRSICETVQYTGDHHKPDIETVIYDSNIRDSMGIKWDGEDGDNKIGVTNFKNQCYNIHMIGDIDGFYCFDTLIDSALIEEGKYVHLRWGDERKFWKYEYNYRSSIAKAMHERLRKKMNIEIPGINKNWDDRTDEEKLAIGKIEHVRWNAYMRTEGYKYSGNNNESSRNDLGKVHHNLVPVTELSDDDLRKDA